MNSFNGAFRILLSLNCFRSKVYYTVDASDNRRGELRKSCRLNYMLFVAFKLYDRKISKVSRAFHRTSKYSRSFVLIPRIHFLLPYFSIVICSRQPQSPAWFDGRSLSHTHDNNSTKICRMTPDNMTVAPWCSGYHYCTTLFNKA